METGWAALSVCSWLDQLSAVTEQTPLFVICRTFWKMKCLDHIHVWTPSMMKKIKDLRYTWSKLIIFLHYQIPFLTALLLNIYAFYHVFKREFYIVQFHLDASLSTKIEYSILDKTVDYVGTYPKRPYLLKYNLPNSIPPTNNIWKMFCF